MFFPPFIPLEGDLLHMESRLSPFKTEGEGGALFVCYDPFFLLGSPIIRIFCPKKCLTTLRVVMSMTYSCSSLERSLGCLFKEVIRARGAVPKRCIPSPDGDVHLGLADRGKQMGP